MAEKKVLGSNDFALERVPEREWSNTFDLSMTWCGWTVYPGGILFGFTLIQAFDFVTSMLLLIAGAVTLAVVAIFMGNIGLKERVSFALASRIGFGDRGSILPSILIAFSAMGWWGVIMLMQIDFWPGISGFLKVVLILFFTFLFTYTSRLGMNKGLKIISRFAVPALVLICVIVIFLAPAHAGGWANMVGGWIPPAKGSMTLGAGYAATLATWIAGAMMCPDVTRFAKNKKGVAIGSFSAFFVGLFGLGVVGILLGLSTGSADMGPAFTALGIGWLAYIAITLGVWTTEQVETYSSSLCLSNAFKIDRIKVENWCVVWGLLVVFGMTFVAGLQNSFIGLLVILGVILPPVPGIIIIEYYLVRKGKIPADIDAMPKINTRGFITYFFCVVICLVANFTGFSGWFFQTPLIGLIIHTIVSAKYIFGKETLSDGTSKA